MKPRVQRLVEELRSLLESEVTKELLRQWQAHGPKVVQAGGKKYKFQPKRTVRTDANTLRFAYGGKRLSTVVPQPLVLIDVTYVRGRDSYDITIEHRPGPPDLTSPTPPPTKRKLKDLYWSHFENLGSSDIMSLGQRA